MATANAPFINASVNVPRQWRNARGYVNTVYAQASIKASQLVESIVKEEIRLTGSVATFNLLNNTAIQLIRATSNGWYTRRIGFKGKAAKYARFAERGRAPGKVPKGVAWLYDWLDAVGIPRAAAWAIKKVIAEDGVEGHYFMRRSRRRAEPQVKAIFDEATRRLKTLITRG